MLANGPGNESIQEVPEGADEWRAPARVEPAGRILAESLTRAIAPHLRTEPELVYPDILKEANAFVEGIFSLAARALRESAQAERYDIDTLNAGSRHSVRALDQAASAFESLLPPEKRPDNPQTG